MSAPLRIGIGILATALLAAGCLALIWSGTYGLTIFVVVPLSLGGLASWFLAPKSGGRAAGIGAMAVLWASCLFLLGGIEGVICILMALPLGMPMGALGGWLVHIAASSGRKTWDAAALAIVSPAALAWDLEATPPVYQVETAVEVAAPPGRVWRNVVTFGELPEPAEWYFRAGIAYPMRARIEGTGAGAVRTCEFSTGPFVEPIEVWDEPRRLEFRVTENPPPMRELSPYGEIAAAHLHGYLVSTRGRFLLAPLPGGRTLLQGTTWYRHGLWPAGYWRWWSDAIIHRIHLRVLKHIRTLSEAP